MDIILRGRLQQYVTYYYNDEYFLNCMTLIIYTILYSCYTLLCRYTAEYNNTYNRCVCQ